MTTPNVKSLALEQVHCEEQVREHFDEERISKLARSLAEVGLQQPIRVRECARGWVVVDGECRLRAARLAGWTEIPAVIEAHGLTGIGIIHRQLVANCQRSDLTPIETARAIARLMREAEWNAGQVAQKLAFSEATVSKLLALLALSAEAQEAVHHGRLPASTAYEIAKVRDPELREALCKDAAEKHLSRNAVLARIRKASPGSKKRTAKKRVTQIEVSLGEGRTIKFAGKGLTAAVLGEWLQELRRRAQEMDLSGLRPKQAAKALSGDWEVNA